MRPDDRELVSRAQQGDAAAFGALVARYQDRVFNTCYRMCHNDADASDMTQTAFLKAMVALPRFEAKASFFTWLFRIVVNTVQSHRRAQQRRPTLSLRHFDEGSGPPLPPAGDPDPASEATRLEAQRQLERALGELDQEFRIAVVLKDIEGMDYATIAEITGVPVGTVKSRIHRGRMMLRSLLEDEDSQRGVG